MRRSMITVGLILGSILSAWLRFDAGFVLLSAVLFLICIIGAMAGWFFAAKRVPHLQFPPDVQELANRDELTSAEETRFADSLRTWHRQQQRAAWREIDRQGPGPLIRTRAALYYLWLSAFALTVLPPSIVPSVYTSQLPRSAVIVLSLALVSIAVAVPLGIRDWQRARRSLHSSGQGCRAE